MRAAIADWEQFVSRYAESSVDEFALEQLRPGDTLRVITEHTDYVFTIDEDAQTRLSCSRADRPSGTVHISGCGFAFCHAFKPGHLFCGGRMEFTFLRGERPTRYRTTSIQTIIHEQRGFEELSFD